jgi:hypothetical protein
MVDSNLLGSTEDFLITKKHFSECLVLLDTISLGIQVKKCMTDFLSIYLLIIGWSLTKLSFLCGYGKSDVKIYFCRSTESFKGKFDLHIRWMFLSNMCVFVRKKI